MISRPGAAPAAAKSWRNSSLSRNFPSLTSSVQPSLTAPGVDIAAARATTGIVTNAFFAVDLVDLGADAAYYTAASGTSMATPHVSGAVALMLQANPGLTPDAVKSLLQSSARPMAYGRHEAGAGYLDAYGAVRAAQGP